MKKNFTLLTGVFMLLSVTSKAQLSENFDGGIVSLSGNCWTFTNFNWSNTSPVISNGTPEASTGAEMQTPFANIPSTLSVSFNYQLTNNLSGGASRIIEVGLMDLSGTFTSLQTFSMNSSSPTTLQSFNGNYTLGLAVVRKLVVRVNGSGSGSAKVMIDNFSSNASYKYGPINHCNSSPVAVKDTFLFTTGMTGYGKVTTNDIEPDNETLSASILTSSPDGTALMNPDGSFSFTPNPGFTGNTSNFTYQICDGGYPEICMAALVTLRFVSGSPLPVKLISFQGNLNNSKISLQWSAAENEINNHFEIEKSFDGKEFSTTGIVMASNKYGTENYSFSETMTAEKVYYRLKMFDKNQVMTYSKILAFQNKFTNAAEFRVINNPVSDKLTLSISSTENLTAEIRVFDLSGRMKMLQRVNMYEGNNLVSLALTSGFQSGIYFVEVNNGSQKQTAKFIKQ